MIMNPRLDSAENFEITKMFQEFVRAITLKTILIVCLIAVIHLTKSWIGKRWMVIIFFINPVGTGMSLARPIQGIIWRSDITKYVPGRSRTKKKLSPKQRDVPKKLILKYLYII